MAMRKESKFIPGRGPRLLSDDAIDTLHQATLRIFKGTGIRVESEQAVQLLHGAGATVEKKDGRTFVKIPPRIVEDCIDGAPATITFYGRDPADDFVAAPGRCSFTNVGVVPHVVDLETYHGMRRNTGKAQGHHPHGRRERRRNGDIQKTAPYHHERNRDFTVDAIAGLHGGHL